MRFLAGVILLAHAFVHLAIWLPPYDEQRSAFDARHSDILLKAEVDERGARRAAVAGALGVAAVFLLAGFGTIRGDTWANEVTVSGAVLSILLAALYFSPWLLLLVVVDLAIVAVAL